MTPAATPAMRHTRVDTDVTVGLIYPDHAAEDDYEFAANRLGVALPLVHIYGTDLHAVAELLDLGSPDKLAHGAALLAPVAPDAVVWACTSGSFVYGWEGAREQCEQLGRAAGVPASSTSFAFTNALAALGVRRVAVAASYPADVAEHFVAFLAAAGVDVVSFASAGIDTAAEVGKLADDEVLRLVVDNDHPDADAVVVPDTAMHSLRDLPRLEAATGKPVLTANQVTVWEGLRLVGCRRVDAELGTLFEIAD